MAVIADSGAIYALYDRDDGHHRAVKAVLHALTGPVVIPMAILGELDYLLREFLGIDAELDLLDSIAGGTFTLEPLTSQDVVRCRELIEQYRDLDLGLADASVVAAAERLGVDRVLTVDERDFRAVRTRGGRPLILLPADPAR